MKVLFCGTVYCAVHQVYMVVLFLSVWMTSLKMEATEQYFVVVQFIMLHKIVLTLSLWMKSCSVTLIQMKATEQYFPVILFIMLYKVVQTFKSVDEILKCDHSNESYWAVLFCDVVYYALQGGSNFRFASADKMLKHDDSNKNYWAASQLSRLEECRSAERKAASSDPHGTSNQGL